MSAANPPPEPPAGGLGAFSLSSGGSGGRSNGVGFITPAAPKNGARLGIALVTGAVLFVVLATLATLAVYGVRRYTASAKSAEGLYYVRAISVDAAAAYERAGETGGHELCPSAAPVPSDFHAVRAKKYPSSSGDWNKDSGWSCLAFEIASPQYYQYRYDSKGSSFRAGATGDLDGDDDVSTFELTGKVVDGRVAVDSVVRETDPGE